jgi:hypothetical protein
MFGWLIIIAAAVLMYRIAEMSEKSGWLWASVTLVVCIACVMLIPLPVINLLVGVGLSYGAMAVSSLIRR